MRIMWNSAVSNDANEAQNLQMFLMFFIWSWAQFCKTHWLFMEFKVLQDFTVFVSVLRQSAAVFWVFMKPRGVGTAVGNFKHFEGNCKTRQFTQERCKFGKACIPQGLERLNLVCQESRLEFPRLPLSWQGSVLSIGTSKTAFPALL